ncbi:MAG: efflux RND transporter periplasmic adaptor subunit [Bryobacterales bacterium]|nr:efflux RND transporter periplasmic adaptor subunit [Bryobacterales bacterium]
MKRFILVGALAALEVVGVGCGGKEGAAKKAAGAAGPAVSVVVAPVVQKTVPVYSEFTARTDANDTVEIRARVAAFLQSMHFQEGTAVKKGQPLFTLDKREFEASLQTAKAQLAKAEADLQSAREQSQVDTARANLEIAAAQLNKADQDVKRLKPLAEQQAVPQQDYDNALAQQQGARAQLEGQKAGLNTAKVNQTAQIGQASASVMSAKAQIQQAELNLEYCNIVSPIDGLIGTRQVAPGNLVGRGDATLLATVSNINPLRVFLSISEAEYLKLVAMKKAGRGPTGNSMEMIMADGNLFPHKGRFIVADRAVDLKTGTLSLIAEFPNPEHLLRPGQFGRVRLAAEVVENAILIPQKAVMEMQSAKVVYVVTADNKVQLRSLTLGDRVGQDYIVTEGLKAGERIVVDGILKVKPGATVAPMAAPVSTEKSEAKKGE